MKETQIHLASPKECTGCTACVSVCPKQCISMQEDREGFLQPKIDANQCIACHKCEKVCPILNPIAIPYNFETQVYAAINKDESIRSQSSSGGVFYPLAKWVIEQGGVVFGARWNDKWEVVHDFAEDLDGVKAFMRSKYVQSIVGDTLRQAKQFLDAGRWVLYSGTPCQLGGLRAYLGKEYERLIQVDLICHGVPSPGVWRSYLKDYFGKEKIVDINFRDKRDGWLGFQCVTTTTTTTYCEKQMENPYFRGFLTNVYLRNSCYNCRFRQFHRASDITLADYWGIDKICPDMHDNKGTSVVFAHTEKGENVLLTMSSDLHMITQDCDAVVSYNKAMIADYDKPQGRLTYFSYFSCLGFRYSRLVIRIGDLVVKINRKIRRVLKLH